MSSQLTAEEIEAIKVKSYKLALDDLEKTLNRDLNETDFYTYFDEIVDWTMKHIDSFMTVTFDGKVYPREQ